VQTQALNPFGNVRFIHNSFYHRYVSLRSEVDEMPAVGLVILGLIIRTILGALIVGALVLLLWKASKLVDAYTEKVKGK
jgi:hypothetical protein